MAALAYILAFSGIWFLVYLVLKSLTMEMVLHRTRRDVSVRREAYEPYISLRHLLQLQIVCGISAPIVIDSILIYANVSFVGAHLAVIVCFAGLGYALPRLWFQHKVNKRHEEFCGKLLDFVLGVRGGLLAGVSFQQAFHVVCKDIGGVFQEEMAIVEAEMEAHVKMIDALKNLEQRMPDENLTLLVTALEMTESTGGRMSVVMEKIAETLQSRSIFKDKIDANTAAGKVDAIFMALAPFGVFACLFVNDPELMKPMVTTYLGWVALTAAIVLDIVGSLIIRKVVAIDF